jgi:environmental stress-induced protein Ves
VIAQLLLARDRVPQPWRNGGGWTTEVLGEPRNPTMDNFAWRISIATIEGDSDFSVFPGIDRHLMPLSPAGLTLEFDAVREQVGQFSSHGFAGEVSVRATGVTETSLDLNLMIRRGSLVGTLVSANIDGPFEIAADPREKVVVIVLEGGAVIDDTTVEPLDAAELGATSTLSGTGVVAIARIRPA